MTQNHPRFCKPAAYQAFQEATLSIHQTDSLIQAAVAISQHLMLDASLPDVKREIEQLSSQVRTRIPNGSQTGVLAHLHQVLFEEQAFQGISADYYNPRNSCLPYVMQSHRGIPITLVLIYKAVGEQLGLNVNGLNCPGHFLAEVTIANDRMIIDPFRRGLMLTQEEAVQYLEQIVNQPIDPAQLTQVTTHTAWLRRILRNLQSIFSMQENSSNLQAMCELEQLVSLDTE
ncbi:MAG: transglutaminase-like domain-containing protein [Pirellulaceae bacterium]|nr:transglutaminase-like domain-containing protein [Pirellulaceae bacterium]